jgi:lysophospholipase L1-like esterase
VAEPAGSPTAAGGAQAGPQLTATPPPAPTGIVTQVPTASSRATVIGDSVVLSAWSAVHALPGVQVDGMVNRQAAEAIEVLRKDNDEGFLGPTVVIHIGSNGPFSARQFDEMMSILGTQRRVIFMNVKVLRPWEGPNNAVIAEGVKRYPNVTLLDWHAAGSGHPEWFRDDGIHTSEVGARAYASLIAQSIR